MMQRVAMRLPSLRKLIGKPSRTRGQGDRQLSRR
jgi:hypothetical protein